MQKLNLKKLYFLFYILLINSQSQPYFLHASLMQFLKRKFWSTFHKKTLIWIISFNRNTRTLQAHLAQLCTNKFISIIIIHILILKSKIKRNITKKLTNLLFKKWILDITQSIILNLPESQPMFCSLRSIFTLNIVY